MDENKFLDWMDRVILGLVEIVSMLIVLMIAVQVMMYFNLF